MHTPDAKDGPWHWHRSYSAMDDVIPLDMIGCELPLAEIYRGIEITED